MRRLTFLGVLAGLLLSGLAEKCAVDFSKPCGEVRPLNGLCNGPLLYGRGRSGQPLRWLKDLEIPYTRFHDAPLENPGMEIVDVSRIFPLFHADYDDPRNFNFKATDDYVRNCLATGTELDFRFGESIEHTDTRYRAVVPPDIDRWAEICVRIARHYRPSVKSWSIWEEPNNKLLLDGPKAYPEAFCRMYVTLAKRLKAEFPDMPVGGPALMGTEEREVRAFLAACREAGAPLDFFSYTNYDQKYGQFASNVHKVRGLLDEYGFKQTAIHLAEWHRGPDSWNISEIGYAAYTESLTGDVATAYAAQVLAGAQDLPVERLYYYKANVGNWGIFDKGERRPTWHVFKTFSDLRKLGPRVAASAPKGWKVLAATGKDAGRLMLAGSGAVEVDVKGGLAPKSVKLIGAGRLCEPVEGWTFRDGRLSLPDAGTKGAVWVVDCARPPVAEIAWTRPLLKDYDRYIGWPTVTRLRSGELVAAFSGDRAAHVCPYGKVQLTRSTDGGETWSKAETVCDGPIDDRDAGVLQLANGDLVLFWFTSLAFYEYADYRKAHPEYEKIYQSIPDDAKRRALGSWARRSTDGGRTWSEPVRVPVMTPHGGQQLRDGRILVAGMHCGQVDGMLQSDPNQPPRTIRVAESADGGRSFRTLATIPMGKVKPHWSLAEPTLHEAADGTLTALIRYELAPDGTWGNDKVYPRFMLRSVSKDGGRTWSEMEPTNLDGFPPHVLRLRDGRLLCSYASRTIGRRGIYAALSYDDGRTWDAAHEFALARSESDDIGYPSTAENADGSLVTVYYAYPEKGRPAALVGTKWRLR